MILLDTNILSELMKLTPHQGVLSWVDNQTADSLLISAVTRAEIELGIALLPEGKRKSSIQKAAAVVFAEFANRCVAFDELAAPVYGQIVAGRIKSGRPISVEDAQIAAVALAYGLKLATRNLRDFSDIPDLTLIDPWN